MTETFRLAHPFWLFALLLIPLWTGLRLRALRHGEVVFPPLQYRHGLRRAKWSSLLRWPIEILLLATLTLALAEPQRVQTLEWIEDEGVDVMLVLDVSLSMLAQDFPPNRLHALRRIAGDFIRRSGGHRIGLVIFAKDTYVQSPLTRDREVLMSLLDGVTTKTLDQSLSGGTAIGDALLVAADRLEKTRIDGRDQAIVLMTDGESNMGADPALAADYLKHLAMHSYAIGIGGFEPVEVWVDGEKLGGDTPYLASLDDGQLLDFAERSQGRYWRAADAEALEEIFSELSRLESAPLQVREVETRRGLGHYLALLCLPLFALYLVVGGMLLRRPFR